MAERTSEAVGTSTQTVTLEHVDERAPQEVRTVRLTLRKTKPAKQVKWSTETVDNEHLNRKKSKCCCIYEKPKNFGESSSESDDECENCFGHVELRKKNKRPPDDSTSTSDDDDEDGEGNSKDGAAGGESSKSSNVSHSDNPIPSDSVG
ncbi:E3 ubiquitin-protein ligase PPP1R11-like isoform X4 [Rhodnius prolixus]|uniref:E3 ubiquitin-protein ligase PPP1R11-like isoform X4 n=1 Tax=Rhodnius prolixus TaxID=13249 RepID=UPI003D18F521